MTIPWIEKYRPKNLSQISSQTETVNILQKTLSSGNLPHLLFYGPPGTGKTSTILALAKEMFGDIFKERVLELNASDERGISVVREKVKNFAKISVSAVTRNGVVIPPFKIVILDEADCMTSDAQSALRRIMETWSKVTRFCLICNYVSRIIDPLTSRCAKFRFKPLEFESILSRLQYVSDQENLNTSHEALVAVIESCGGDLRKAIMFLQSASRLFSPNEISKEGISDISGLVPNGIVLEFLNSWISRDSLQSQKLLDEFVKQGYSAVQLLSQVFSLI
jgi:replication factor C subunit 2/4